MSLDLERVTVLMLINQQRPLHLKGKPGPRALSVPPTRGPFCDMLLYSDWRYHTMSAQAANAFTQNKEDQAT